MQPRCVRGSWSLFVSLLFCLPGLAAFYGSPPPCLSGLVVFFFIYSCLRVHPLLSPRLQLVGCIRFLFVLLCPGQAWWPWPPSDSQISLPCLASRKLHPFCIRLSPIIRFPCLVAACALLGRRFIWLCLSSFAFVARQNRRRQKCELAPRPLLLLTPKPLLFGVKESFHHPKADGT